MNEKLITNMLETIMKNQWELLKAIKGEKNISIDIIKQKTHLRK